ncbi:hypothetical protein LEP1GSC195_1380 [Leptospira wolbachii serovar Codice str. CDC]|uniref:Uncharacterized protein n=1 Tax=Leptospira wolbachii serovar Codice str. CDC TaxID=1218599 RepID=R8ZYJ2_9LEPT|nr:hypothetical protein [Leptospira wolbachii]EOQ94789.1 hypothetical protein LEP1GSC195_1380 [Leptospira wolbachii serovar Codice str. CDC]
MKERINYRNFLLIFLALHIFSCSIPTFVVISNYSGEKIEIHFYLKKNLNKNFLSENDSTKDIDFQTEEDEKYKIKNFIKKWKSVPARNVLKKNYSGNSKFLTENEIRYDFKNNKIVLIVEEYTAIILFEGHNYMHPLPEYISKISFEHKKGSMSFEKDYINFPFSYEENCSCLIWKIY